jgi:hypothetical protein
MQRDHVPQLTNLLGYFSTTFSLLVSDQCAVCSPRFFRLNIPATLPPTEPAVPAMAPPTP